MCADPSQAPALPGLGLAMGVMILLSVISISASAQQKEVCDADSASHNRLLKGTVITAVTNLPLEGVAIRVKGSDKVSFTDTNGTFEIVSHADTVLLVSYMGYESQRVPIQDGRLKNNHIRLTRDLSKVTPLIIGDSIPDYLWDLPVSVVNHPQGRTVITLREYQSKKLLILDFWARWCAPCVKSVDQWEVIQKEFPDELAVLTVHMDVADRALPFIQQRSWSLPALVGENYHIVNRHFFNRYQVGGVVMICQGKLFAIPDDKGHDIVKLRKLLDGEPVEYTSMIRLTNSETLEEGRAK
ncbi:carboxypeptidase-like regulatory domain-containing protein [Parapedobacter sp. DT-150]|uniref:carboxypeptidase-like regulatory domain-containing protein n=1 Tax=Parapedobacter sp. DT-150 TaxID=3396162 RepID=UPI003F1B0243